MVDGLQLDSLDLEFFANYGMRALQGQKWEAYKAVYREAMDREPCEWKRHNAGRKAANTRLREYQLKIEEKDL